ncbi:MAG: hypothetical protein P9M14_01685 [Candidatus Alcyoniella australis]|nr:hypothetical protein [Candidatus Alcyoniella australis]
MRLRCLLLLLLVPALVLLASFACEDGGGDDEDDSDDDDDSGDDDSGGDGEPPTMRTVTELGNTDDQTGPYPVEARITDNVRVAGVRLYYDLGQGFQDFWMTKFGADGYRGQIPGQEAGSTIRYFVKAWDDALNESYWPAGGQDAPQVFHVRGTVALAYDDDLLPDSYYGVQRAGDCLVVRFTPPSYPAQFLTFSHYIWDYQMPPDDRYRPIVLFDPSASGIPPMPNVPNVPNDGIWRGEIVEEGTIERRTWYNFEFDGEPELEQALESGDAYIGVEFVEVANDEEDILTFGLDTTDPTHARTWYFDQSRLTWINIDEHLHVKGNLMFRSSVQLQ